MNRQQMISILQTMSDDSLMQAMSAVGIDASCDDEGYEMGEPDGDEGLQPWNERDVSVEDANKPELFNKAQITKQPMQEQQMAPTREYLADGEPMDDYAEYMMHSGM